MTDRVKPKAVQERHLPFYPVDAKKFDIRIKLIPGEKSAGIEVEVRNLETGESFREGGEIFFSEKLNWIAS